MELSGDLFPASWLWFLTLALLPLYWLALRWSDLRRVQRESLFSPYFGTLVTLLVLWALRTEIVTGVSWHLSGMVFATLMWGWSLALLGAALVLLGLALAGISEWSAIVPSLWLGVVLPATLTQVVLGLVRAYLPKHFFVFVFVNAFFCGALVAVVVALTATVLLYASGAFEWEVLRDRLLVLVPLMVFPEAFVNGGITSVLIGLRPEWVWSFRDEEYIDGH
jgi:uncharacterized membrane protein